MKNSKRKAASDLQEAPAKKKGFSLIPDRKLISLYASMLRFRMLEERMQSHLGKRSLARSRESLAGQEAAVVGVAIQLLPEDTIGPSSAALAANFVKGASLEKTLRPLFELKGSRVSSPQCDASFDLETGIAIGIAFANKNQKNGKISVTFLGNQHGRPDSWYEALHFAGAHRLPIVFVSQGSEPVPDTLRESHVIPRIAVDGSDVVAVYRVACEAITHARKGNGPTLIECVPYGADGQTGARPSGTCNSTMPSGSNGSDPILNMERYLACRGLFDKHLKSTIIAGFRKELSAAIMEARK